MDLAVGYRRCVGGSRESGTYTGDLIVGYRKWVRESRESGGY